ncbi:hypothetical protein GH714_030594 [Hevea brasiliensis]|uniref:Uncharacterized protein n=1 Tax=Hevea brasiliensis TaxID=3981 RepID=A0A6A6LKG8_HEVBR|nr:hypothetical protein GH714_030594 [Hevea brasiliensis]
MDLVNSLFNERDVSLLLSIPLSMDSREDGWLWEWAKQGAYSVKSGYKVQSTAQNEIRFIPAEFWVRMWKMDVHAKVGCGAQVWNCNSAIVLGRGSRFTDVMQAVMAKALYFREVLSWMEAAGLSICS